jgi:8-oxo-dGTP diphosphatase
MSAAIAIIFDETGSKILILKRRDVPMWVLPGGGIDVDETAENAAIREVLEETGLHVKIVRKIAEYTPLNKLAKDTFLFECKAVSGKIITGDETQEIGFYPFSNLPKPFFPVHQDWIDDALMNSPEVIKKTVERVTYWNVFKYFCQHPIWVIRFLLTRLGFQMNK